MKPSPVLLAALVAFLFSCSAFDRMDVPPGSIEDQYAPATKTTGTIPDAYAVSQSDFQSYIHFLETLKGEKPSIKVVDSKLVEENGIPVYYILNFEKGWQLLSADKRGPVVLGSCDSGRFDVEDRNPGELSWIAGLADDIAFRRNCPDDYYGKITQEALSNEEGCLDFWKAITVDPEYMEDHLPSTKSTLTHTSGHWELMFSTPSEIKDSIPHLLTTRWHQEHPFRKYIPRRSAADTTKCAVGCVAIAAAQVFYYLHYRIGVPATSPTLGFCTGWADNYTATFPAFSSQTWDNMELEKDDSTHFTSLFIGYVATSLEPNFGPSTSSTLLKIKNTLAPAFGLSCERDAYDKDVVFDNLRQRLPVIFGGNRYNEPFDYPGHAFVIDGYESTQTQYRLVYWWVYDDLPATPGLIGDFDYPGNLIEYDYSTPVALNFRLNWGYGDNDDTQYSTDGIWTYPGRTPYQYNRRILYDFESIN